MRSAAQRLGVAVQRFRLVDYSLVANAQSTHGVNPGLADMPKTMLCWHVLYPTNVLGFAAEVRRELLRGALRLRLPEVCRDFARLRR
jgi:hypothetical protein